MTTTVIVQANHGWPVDVRPLGRGGAAIGATTRVEPGAEASFCVHSRQDLFVREVQPDEFVTLGEYRVGVTFNPSAIGLVDQIKLQAAALIDLIDTIPSAEIPEAIRLKVLAMTHVEDAAIWAVKAATKPPLALKA